MLRFAQHDKRRVQGDSKSLRSSFYFLSRLRRSTRNSTAALADLKEYIEILERPERDKGAEARRGIKALNLDRFMTIADIGAGSGYFTRKFALWAVQDKGMVYAVDIEPGMLKYNEEMVEHMHTPYNAKFVWPKRMTRCGRPRAWTCVPLQRLSPMEKRADYFTRVKAALTKKGRIDHSTSEQRGGREHQYSLLRFF